MSYVELHACSAFSFLRGGSFPEHLAATAASLEIPAVGLLDRDGVYGAQRFSVAARENGVRPIVGCELSMEDGAILPVLVENRAGYKNLCELLTEAHLRSEKGKCCLRWDELPRYSEGLVALLGSALVSSAGCGVSPQRSFKSPRSRDECATQKGHQSFAVSRQFIPAYTALPLLAPQMRFRQEFAEIFITHAILHQNGQNRAAFHAQLAPDDWTDAVFARGDGESLGAINPITIQQADCRNFQRGGGGREMFRKRSSTQKAKSAAGMKLDIRHKTTRAVQS
jgi:error-prone DNA polymerase